MYEEFEQIAKQLLKCCKKYNKDYANIAYINNHVIGNLDPKDKDYTKINFYISEED